MIDPILRFPRVIHERRDPTTDDDRSEGIIEGNIWINIDTGRVYICVNSELGTWVAFIVTGQAVAGADFSFGDGSVDLTADFNLGQDGTFQISAGNVILSEIGDFEIAGSRIVANRDLSNEGVTFWSKGTDQINYESDVLRDGVISWNPTSNAWFASNVNSTGEGGSFDYVAPIGVTVIAYRDPVPEDDFDHGYFLSQMWLNVVTQQKFTCMSCMPSEPAVWRLALTSAPTKSMVEYDDYIILYGSDDDSFMKISVNDFALYIQDAVGGFGTSTAGYAWLLDGSDNITISEEDPITQGIFEEDGSGALQPITGAEADVFFEFDLNDDIQPKAA